MSVPRRLQNDRLTVCQWGRPLKIGGSVQRVRNYSATRPVITWTEKFSDTACSISKPRVVAGGMGVGSAELPAGWLRRPMSDLALTADIANQPGHVRSVPILLQKSAAADGRSSISLSAGRL
jgi:hypothetical protein